MQEKVRVAVVQMNVEWLKPQNNLSKIKKILREITHKDKVDLVVFPELCNSGYVISRDKKDFDNFCGEYYKVAEKIPGQFTDSLCDLAKKYKCHLVIGLLEIHPTIPGTLFNSAILINSKGKIIGHHRKAHIPVEEKHYFYPGNNMDVFPTELGNVGILICADNAHPEAAKVLCVKGAEIVCICYARPEHVGIDPELNSRIFSCRAFENNVFIVACNRVGQEGKIIFEGRSGICGPRGNFLALSRSKTEEVIKANLLAEEFVRARIKYSRFRDRRPDLYGSLTLPFDAT